MRDSRIAALIGALAVTGCAVGPDHRAPEPAVAPTWRSLDAAPTAAGSVAVPRSADLSDWWRAFNDPVLVALVERAADANLDLRGAGARVRESRALRAAALGGLLPQATVRGSHERTRFSEKGAFPVGNSSFDLFKGGFDASWEIDVFGGSRRNLEAASADADAAVEEWRDLRVSLVAEVARNYVELRGSQARIAIARQNLGTQQRTVELTRARLDAGQTTELDVARAEALAASTSAVIPGLEAAMVQSMHALDVLLARQPGAMAEELDSTTPIPAAPAEIPVGMPTELLRRRPDLRRAERELAAATARVGVATADLYPRFFLTGTSGFESIKASDFFSAESRTWSLGPSIRWPLFQGGRIRAGIDAQTARQEYAALAFEQTLLNALRDVENALVAHSREQARRALLAAAVASQRQAVDLAGQRYTQGLVDFLTVLEAQRSLYAAQDDLVVSEEAIATSAISLYKALGGGWVEEPASSELAVE